jgi:hypothetical protein
VYAFKLDEDDEQRGVDAPCHAFVTRHVRPRTRHRGPSDTKRLNGLWETSAETSLELVPRPTQKSQTPPWMTVRPQHHRRPPPRPRRHWRRLLYNLPHLISLLSLLFRPRHREKETVPTTLSVQMSAALGSLYGFPSDSSLSFFDILISLSISSCYHRGQWQHSVPDSCPASQRSVHLISNVPLRHRRLHVVIPVHLLHQPP